MVKIEKLSKSFTGEDNRRAVALDGLDIEIKTGSLVVLMGPNGSGKTTLFRILDGQLNPDSGVIRWNARLANSPANGRPYVRHVPQEPHDLAFPDMTLAEHILWAELADARPRFWVRGINKARLASYRSILETYNAMALTEALNSPLRTLSSGWQQIFVLLLAAIARRFKNSAASQLLLLDEPTSSLDEENTRRCLDLIRQLHHEGWTIVMTTHDVYMAIEMAERVCVLRKGRLAADLAAADISSGRVDWIRAALMGTEEVK